MFQGWQAFKRIIMNVLNGVHMCYYCLQMMNDSLKKIQIVIITNNLFMMKSSNGNISALLALFARNSPVTGEFTSQRPASFDVFVDLRLE